jgi:hypothetical protein
MKVFLKFIDERVLIFVERGWNKPTSNTDEWPKDK